jgi:hypothetical protein
MYTGGGAPGFGSSGGQRWELFLLRLMSCGVRPSESVPLRDRFMYGMSVLQCPVHTGGLYWYAARLQHLVDNEPILRLSS